MSIANYSDLQAAVASWLHRTDLTADIPDFIRLAEAQLNRDVRLRGSGTVETGTLAGANLAYPATINVLERVSITANGREYTLDYVAPGKLADYSDTAYQPLVYTALGGELILAPPPDDNYPYTLYFAPTIHLSAAAPTNYLLTMAPDAYLYGTLLVAALHIVDDDRIPTWRGAYQMATASLQDNEDRQRYAQAQTLAIKHDVRRP